VSGANGIVRGANASANATQLILPGGSSTTQAYVDLPNGIISALTDATFEAWYTIDNTTSWARIFDFGSTVGGELTGPGGGGSGQDYIVFSASRGTNISQQRTGTRNNNANFLGSAAGTVGETETLVDTNIAHTLDTQRHVAVVFNSAGGTTTTPASLTVYINGVRRATGNTAIQLRNLNDVNDWLGRSNWTSDANFDGMVNECRIYDRPFSPGHLDFSFDSCADVVPELGLISLDVFWVICPPTSTTTDYKYVRRARHHQLEQP
jgi:hypothetical protein